MKRQMTALCAGLLLLPTNALAQDVGMGEVVVTASRIDQNDYSNDMPAVGLRRSADFLIQEVRVSGDARNEVQRRTEIYSMIEKALNLAKKHGVQLAFGDFVVEPLTLANYTNLTLTDDRAREDSEFTAFLVKFPLANGTTSQDAEKRIASFIDDVPEVGRAQMDKDGDVTFSVVAPDSYRDLIAAKIAEDANKMAEKMGEGYAVQVEGLNMPVQWTRSGLSEVFLFIPYKLVIVPKP